MAEPSTPTERQPTVLDCDDLMARLEIGRDASLAILRQIGRRAGKRLVCTPERLRAYLETNDSGDKK